MSEVIVLSQKEREEVIEEFKKEQEDMKKFYENIVRLLNPTLDKKKKDPKN